jgi:two-component system chemotaxis response regulator CheB
MRYEAVVIGVSSGGLNALGYLLPALPANFAFPVIIVQHIGNSTDGFWIENLNELCQLRVKEADEKEKIEKGTVYIAPANYHLLVETDRTFSLSTDERVNFARPSIDVLFESASIVYGDKLIGVILTGANSDGAIGLKKIKDEGGLAVVQDPRTAVATQMPMAAIKTALVDYIVPLEKLIDVLLKLEKL